MALLGSPVSQRLARASGRTEGQMGRGSGCLAHPGPLFNNHQARAIYRQVVISFNVYIYPFIVFISTFNKFIIPISVLTPEMVKGKLLSLFYCLLPCISY